MSFQAPASGHGSFTRPPRRGDADAPRKPPPDRVTGHRFRAARALPLALILPLAAGCGYDRIHELEAAAGEARSEVEVQLRRLAELVPNLLETLERYGAVGDETVASVADARAGLVAALGSGDLGAMERWSARLAEAVGGLVEKSRLSPGLEADAGFHLLLSQLQSTEDAIAARASSYNEAARRFNVHIAEFPHVLTAKLIGARPLELFEPGLPGVAPGSNR